ncbi:hypothetical protein [Mesorhizobium sp.]|uniref:hypothetical protein n=1 Tax=Mesorhizobium sp. TaxID=1871066 RepID=UPI0012174008|nr:hypothetical protein [Mesorhizobium sp.]TIQ11014.1 MAG: hypothetical protein E5X50_09500 [Mesorhizobium sp.]
MMVFDDDLIERATWFCVYARDGHRTNWTIREMLAQRFKLTPEASLELFKLIMGRGGANGTP